MTRIYLGIIAFLAILVFVLYFKNSVQSERIVLLNNDKKEQQLKIEDLENAIINYQQAQSRAAEKIEKVRTIVRTTKSNCNCYNTPLPDDVRQLLHESK